MRLSKITLCTLLAIASAPAEVYSWPGMANLDSAIARRLERDATHHRSRSNTEASTQNIRSIGIRKTNRKRVAQTEEEEEGEEEEGEEEEGEEEEGEEEEGEEEEPPEQEEADESTELIGDLKTVGPITPVGKAIARIILRQESGETSEAGYRPALLGTKACKQDTCCVWSYVSAALTLSFRGILTGRCNDNARAAIRLGFHDAGTWSKKLAAQGKDFGGADGSIVLNKDEIKRAENRGLEDIVKRTKILYDTFKGHGVGMADLIQFMAIHAVVTCPLGPRLRMFVGRKDSSRAAPDGLLPGVNQSADELISLFEDKTIGPHELAALVGAHSTSRQFFVDKKRSGAPQDDTPGVWDTRFYNQTIQAGGVPKRVFRLASDIVLSQHPRVKTEWDEFAAKGGQDHWNKDYATAYTRLSLLGVNNINSLQECSKVLPPAQRTFRGAGEGGLYE